LTELTRQIVDDADFEARSRNRSVKLDASESCRIVGTEHLLRRAIENVVRNAVQYTAPATEVEVKLERIQQSENAEPERKRAVLGSGQSPPGNAAVITVRDYGSGVPENALSEIFRPFYRVDDARDREAGGVGLGLAIADRAVRLHGGTVRAANVSPNGLAVTIVLPANTPAAQPTK
jgi:two-component system sensor histidine kinase CpxA